MPCRCERVTGRVMRSHGRYAFSCFAPFRSCVYHTASHIRCASAYSSAQLLARWIRPQASSPEEEQLLARFKEVQLRMRDGEVTVADWEWLFEHCSFDKRVRDMHGPGVFRLVMTRKLRDEQNAERLEQEVVEGGRPSLKIDAINSAPLIANMDDDVVELPNELRLSLGARVMITKNLSIKMGLVNGTLGVVHDIMVNSNGTPVAVLVKVRRAGAGVNGYSGPSFMEGLLEGVDDESEAVVPVGLYTVRYSEDKQTYTRQQFPLMLACARSAWIPTLALSGAWGLLSVLRASDLCRWTLTVHKAQGLTLDRVLYDPGFDEPNDKVGCSFVALTRVRHPFHFCFRLADGTFPDVERLTESIRSKPSLWLRRDHEYDLRARAVQTARALQHLNPPPQAFELPRKVQRPPAKKPKAVATKKSASKKAPSAACCGAPARLLQQAQLQTQEGAPSASFRTLATSPKQAHAQTAVSKRGTTPGTDRAHEELKRRPPLDLGGPVGQYLASLSKAATCSDTAACTKAAQRQLESSPLSSGPGSGEQQRPRSRAIVIDRLPCRASGDAVTLLRSHGIDTSALRQSGQLPNGCASQLRPQTPG